MRFPLAILVAVSKASSVAAVAVTPPPSYYPTFSPTASPTEMQALMKDTKSAKTKSKDTSNAKSGKGAKRTEESMSMSEEPTCE
jgi:hypothetical protein